MLNWIRPDDWGSYWYGFVSFPALVIVACIVVTIVDFCRWRPYERGHSDL